MICDKCGITMDERKITCYIGGDIDFCWCDRCNPYIEDECQQKLS